MKLCVQSANVCIFSLVSKTRNVFVKYSYYASTIRLLIQNAKVGHNSDKCNPKFTKILSGYVNVSSKLLAKFHDPYSSGSLDILLTRFSFVKLPKSEKGSLTPP